MIKTANLLLEHSADVSLKNVFGTTVHKRKSHIILHLLIPYLHSQYMTMVAMLGAGSGDYREEYFEGTKDVEGLEALEGDLVVNVSGHLVIGGGRLC